MINLELEQKKLELSKVKCAKDEMKFKILQRQSEIERLQENMENQEKRIKELEEEISNL